MIWRRPSAILLVAAFAVQLAPTPARCQPQNRTPYRVEAGVELPLTVGIGLTAALLPGLLTERTLEAPPCGRCDPNHIWLGLDRSVVRNDSRAASLASDLLLGSLVAGALFGSLIDVGIDDDDEGARGWAADLMVTTEALTIDLALTQLVKHLVRRPRPYAYNPNVALARKLDRDASLSFFSGHASLAFASATALSYTFWQRHPSDALGRGLVLGLSLAAATGTGYLRVRAGKHFWSDVVVGALVGGAVGLLVPLLHDRDRDRDPGCCEEQVVPLLAFSGQI